MNYVNNLDWRSYIKPSWKLPFREALWRLGELSHKQWTFSQVEFSERGACTGESPLEGALSSSKVMSQQQLFHRMIFEYFITGDGNLPLYPLFTPFEGVWKKKSATQDMVESASLWADPSLTPTWVWQNELFPPSLWVTWRRKRKKKAQGSELTH